MRFSKSAAVIAVSAGSLLLAPGIASAAEPDEVSYSYGAEASALSNTIVNNSGTPLTCSTSVAPAPNGELPPVEQIAAQDLSVSGEVPVGTTVQTLTDIPDGDWVVLSTCGRQGEDPAVWASEYPGIETVLDVFPYPAFAVQQASSVVTFPVAATTDPVTAPETTPDTEQSAPTAPAERTFLDVLRDIAAVLFGS